MGDDRLGAGFDGTLDYLVIVGIGLHHIQLHRRRYNMRRGPDRRLCTTKIIPRPAKLVAQNTESFIEDRL